MRKEGILALKHDAIFACVAVAAPAAADELSGTLKKVKQTGVIALGHRESSLPFSFYKAF